MTEELKSVPSISTNDETQDIATFLPFMIENKDSSRELRLECIEEDTQSSSMPLTVKGGEWLETNDMIMITNDKGQITTDEERTRQKRTSEDSEERRGKTPLLFTDKTQESAKEQDLDQDSCPSRFATKKEKCMGRAERLGEKSDGERTEQEWELKSRKTSLRARLVHAKTRVCSHTDDRTVRGEREFLRTIEKHKNQRLERLCICPVTRWLLFKVRFGNL
ncbi:hypothetical protein Aduo_012422 [Ancylostoma duodenale]